MNNTFKRNEVVDLLKETVCTVKFTKADGSVREMKCTLALELIPLEQRPTPNADIDNHINVINVFDVEKARWRAFRVDSIISIEV